MRTWTLVVSLLASLGLIAGCAGVDGDSTNGDPGPRTSGLALSSDTLADTDVTGMKFKVEGCSGTPTSGISQTVKKDLEDMYLPGGISEWEDKPYDADSKHLFSDHYFLLPAGCYDVVTQPLKLVGQTYKKSDDCFSAHQNGVTVEDGKTREILLISQCLGPEKGGLDVIGTINHPPEILNVEFKDSKFLNSCTGRNEVCVTVRDVDNDPIQIEWGTSQNFNYLGNIRPATQSPAMTVNNDDSITYCGEVVTGPRGDVSLREALAHDYEITTLTRPFLQKWAELGDHGNLDGLLADDNRDGLREWMWGRNIIDVIQDWPIEGLTPQKFVELLRKLPPRLYSIASSHTANPDEIHLTVAVVRYHSHGRDREGVATTWLADRIAEDGRVPVYIDHNKNFKLPDDDSAPTIMIGPGTGVAPFRCFMEEREERGASGRNWLFFGDQHFQTDFLYQREWLRWRESGVLDRIDVAAGEMVRTGELLGTVGGFIGVVLGAHDHRVDPHGRVPVVLDGDLALGGSPSNKPDVQVPGPDSFFPPRKPR